MEINFNNQNWEEQNEEQELEEAEETPVIVNMADIRSLSQVPQAPVFEECVVKEQPSLAKHKIQEQPPQP